MQPPAYWYGPDGPPLAARLGERLYRGITRARRAAYARGVLKPRHPGVPVVVVGNLVAGGSGKTPATIAIVERLAAAGHVPGVASRGYGREGHGAVWVDANTPAHRAGDEPLLIARRTGVRVRVDRARAAAAQSLADAGCTVVVCDDGLQHYSLARDVEIEVIDGRRRYGNGRLLPAGPLREPAERGVRCDFRVLNVGDGAILPGFGEWPMRLSLGAAEPLHGRRSRPLATLAGQRVHAVAGIAEPQRFFDALKARGIAVVPHAFPDHHDFRAGDLDFASPLPILMTEKDAVKCAPFAPDDAYAVPLQAELPEAFWAALLARIEAVRA